MATKKEMVAELVSLGANEDEIKDLKNSELEAMLKEAKAAVADEGAEQEQEKEVKEEAPAKETEKEYKDEPKEEEGDVEVLRETSVQLSIFKDYVYNVKHKKSKVVVENLGYGDAYVSEEGLAEVGKSKRLSFKESAEFEGVERLYFASASQPVIQIIEVK